jgi:CDP-diacylglycerol--glycerol-3-phosphate 3-phosphatidyltransferase
MRRKDKSQMLTRMKKWLFYNSANMITMFGFALCPFLLWAILASPAKLWLSFTLLALIIASDFADGKVARHFKIISQFGSVADRLRDKLCLAAVFTFLLTDKRLDSLKTVTILLLAIESLLLILLFVGLIKRVDVSANWWGKNKMAFLAAISLATVAALISEEELKLGMLPWMLIALEVFFFAILPFSFGSLVFHIKHFRAQLRAKSQG